MWQAILLSFALGFTERGQHRFVQRGTGLVLDVEERAITQSLVGLGQEAHWRALENFPEHGSWDIHAIQDAIARRVAALPASAWHGCRVRAGDDTKVHRHPFQGG